MADADGEAQVLEGASEVLRDDSEDEIVRARPSRLKKTKRVRPQEAVEAVLACLHPPMPLAQLSIYLLLQGASCPHCPCTCLLSSCAHVWTYEVSVLAPATRLELLVGLETR